MSALSDMGQLQALNTHRGKIGDDDAEACLEEVKDVWGVSQPVVAEACGQLCQYSAELRTMHKKKVSVQSLAAFLPASLRLLVELPDRVEDPAPSPLHARLELLGLQMDLFRVGDLARVVRVLARRERAVRLEEDSAPGVLDVGVVDELEVRGVVREQVASVG